MPPESGHLLCWPPAPPPPRRQHRATCLLGMPVVWAIIPGVAICVESCMPICVCVHAHAVFGLGSIAQNVLPGSRSEQR